jgi:2-iminoacetate synthase ThiH
MSRELLHFQLLDRSEQEQAVRRLAASGMGDYTIAAATQLSVEVIRRILGKGHEPQERRAS